MTTLAERKAKLYANYQSKGLSPEEFKKSQRQNRENMEIEKQNKRQVEAQKKRDERSEYYRIHGSPLEHFEEMMSTGLFTEKGAYDASLEYSYDQ
jgi:hypothetical protein